MISPCVSSIFQDEGRGARLRFESLDSMALERTEFDFNVPSNSIQSNSASELN
jgi:hypothetical protein